MEAVAVQADASSADFGDVLVDAALKAFDTATIDVIVNCSGKCGITQSSALSADTPCSKAFYLYA